MIRALEENGSMKINEAVAEEVFVMQAALYALSDVAQQPAVIIYAAKN